MAQTAGNQSRRSWIWIALILIVAGWLLYLALPSSRERVTVRAARVDRQDLRKDVSTNGKVEPLIEFQPHATLASTVQTLPVHLGQNVTKGQELLLLNATDARSRIAEAHTALQTSTQSLQNMQSGGTHEELLGEQADLAAAQAQLTQATTGLNALKALQARGAASANEVAAAQQRVSDAQAKFNQIQARMSGRYAPGDLATSQSQITQARQQLAAAQSELADLDIHSPITGTVYSLPVARFDYVQPGQPLISVADLNKLQVRAYFDEPEIGSLAAGQAVRIVWDAKPDRVWNGHITQAPTTVITFGTRNVGECLISVDDADGQLLPNTNVTTTVTLLQHFGVLSLPREALHTEGGVNFVYRIINDRLVRTPVTVGVVTQTRFEITSGVTAGQVVALGATTDTDLQNGLRVRIQH